MPVTMEGGIRTPEPEGVDLQSAASLASSSLPFQKYKQMESRETELADMELQSIALPTELLSHIAGAGFEPTTFLGL